MKCQAEPCQTEVRSWRACGLGCGDKFSRAYCKEHGGEERAISETREHHEQVHGGVQ